MRYKFSQKKILAAVVVLLSLLIARYGNWQVAEYQLSNSEYASWVKKVIDGDTVELTNGERVRYIGINTPEIAHYGKAAEYYGKEAKEFNKRLVLGKNIRLEFDEERYDKYSRTLAYVYLEDGTFVNAELVKLGYAKTMPIKPNTRYAELFKQMQNEAKIKRKGVWAR